MGIYSFLLDKVIILAHTSSWFTPPRKYEIAGRAMRNECPQVKHHGIHPAWCRNHYMQFHILFLKYQKNNQGMTPALGMKLGLTHACY